jgi:hypothetical protein
MNTHKTQPFIIREKCENPHGNMVSGGFFVEPMAGRHFAS